MTKLIVHMGLHRTATTTLQTSLRALGEEDGVPAFILREHMAANPALDMRRWHSPNALSFIRHMFMNPTQDFAKTVMETGASRVVVSEENLIGTMPGVKDGHFYPHFERFVGRLKKLDDYLSVHPRLVVRRQDKFLESVYAFRVARGLTDDFPTFLSRFNISDLDWNRFAEALEVFGACTQIAVLEEWMESERVAENALAFLGVYATGLGKGRGNRSLSPESTALILAFNRAGQMMSLEDRRRALFPKLSKLELAGDDVANALAGITLPAATKQTILKTYAAKPQVCFTPESRSGFLAELASVNSQFLRRPEVLAGPEVWA